MEFRRTVRRILQGEHAALDDLERVAHEATGEAGGPVSLLLDLCASSELSDVEQQGFRAAITSSRKVPDRQQRWFCEAVGRQFDARMTLGAAPMAGTGIEDVEDVADVADPDHDPPPDHKRSTRKALGTSVTRLSEIVGLVLGIPVLITILWNFAFSDDSNTTRVLIGDLNVSVAQFAATDGEHTVEVDDLSQTFGDQLTLELERRAAEPAADGSVLSVDVLSSPETGVLDVEPIEALLSDSESIASVSHADAVVTAAVSPDRRTVTPYLYIPPTSLPDALELTGVLRLGSPIEVRAPLDENVAALGTIRSTLIQRSSSMAEFLIGVNRFGNGQYDEARARFEAALELIPDEVDEGVVLLFLGNTALKQDDLDAAQEYYEAGLEVDSGVRPRLMLGLTETRFHEVRGDCSPASTSVADLEQVIDGYREAISLGDPTAGSLFAARTQFGLARAEVCLAAFGEDRWQQASDRYVALVRGYEDGPAGAQDLVAESLAGLGFIAGNHGTLWDEEVCADAAACYARAAETAIDEERVEDFRRLAAEAADG